MTRQATPSCCDHADERASNLATIDETVTRAVGLCAAITESEPQPLLNAVGRTAAGDVVSLFALPLHDHSAVDGYALSQAGRASQRVIGRIAAGDVATRGLAEGEAVRIMTGAPVPPGTTAVVMQEHATRVGDCVEPTFEVEAGDNIRRAGEDIAAMEPLLRAGAQLDARHVAILAASGYRSIHVTRKIRVGILSSGNELRDPGVGMGAGSIFDTNRPMLSALLGGNAIDVTDLGILPDDLARISDVLRDAAKTHDLIITSGGVSVGEEDHLKPAVQRAGGHIECWRMAIKPGKPIALGMIGKAVYLGLPGNPLACFVDHLLVGRPILQALAGTRARQSAPLQARAAFTWMRRPGRCEFFPANIVGTSTEGLPLLEKTGRAGSARLLPLIEADGLGMVEGNVPEVTTGSPLSFFPFRAGMGL